MNNFEKEYYEYEGFWQKENLKKDDIDRIDNVINLIPPEVKTILDVGCGNGIFCNKFKELSNKFVIGLDRSVTALSFVQTEKIISDISQLPFQSAEFDLVVALETLEHLPLEQYDKAIYEVSRVSKKYILVSVPNCEDLQCSLIQCPTCFTIFNPSYHMRSFNKNKLMNLFISKGFSVKHIFNVVKSHKYIFINKIKLFFRIFTGFNKNIEKSICPMCGFSKREISSMQLIDIDINFKIRRLLKNTVKKVWPKKISYKWLIALYERN